MSSWRGTSRQWAVLVVGMLLLGIGVAISIQAAAEVRLGVGSWQVFETGLVEFTGARFGVVVFVESFVALALAWVLFRIPPGPATLFIALFIGPMVDVLLGVIPSPTTFGPAVAMFVAGTVGVGLGVGLYVSADLGPSAQDSLFVGMFTRLNMRPAVARLVLDGLLTIGGWLLGGTIGVGTVLVLLIVPPAVERSLLLGQRLAGTDLTPDHPSELVAV